MYVYAHHDPHPHQIKIRMRIKIYKKFDPDQSRKVKIFIEYDCILIVS